MEAADFIESILNEIFRKNVVASRSTHLEVFCENYTADYLSYEQTHFKIPADVVFIF